MNDGTYDPDSISGKSFMVEYDPKNALRIRVLFDKPLVEKRNYRLEFIDLDDKTEKRLNEAAREVGEGGVIYWSPRNDRTPDIRVAARMKDFLRKYRPRDKKGKKLDVEIKIVDFLNLDELFE